MFLKHNTKNLISDEIIIHFRIRERTIFRINFFEIYSEQFHIFGTFATFCKNNSLSQQTYFAKKLYFLHFLRRTTKHFNNKAFPNPFVNRSCYIEQFYKFKNCFSLIQFGNLMTLIVDFPV